ncbi:MAG: RNase adapter RapZ [Pseudomonadota bacterium]
MPDPAGQHRLVLVTGPSGAGRSTAIRALEDLGYEAIDNLPLSLLPRLLDSGEAGRALAIGVDVRTRGFSASALIEAVDALATDPATASTLLYVDCAQDALVRRFSETRRRHPLAPAEAVADGIARELDLLLPLRARADILIDTSASTIHDTRAEIGRWFGDAAALGLALSIQSFSYKRGMPRGLDMVLDVRFLRNPYWQAELRDGDGRDPDVAAYVAGDPRHDGFAERVLDLLLLLLPAYREEGKSYFAVGFGCTGGQHRSVHMAETVAKRLAAAGWQVSTRHRELERRAASCARDTATKRG